VLRTPAQRNSLVLFGLAVVSVAAILHAYRLVLESRIIEEAPHADRFPILGLLCVFVGHLGWLHYSQAVLDAMNQDGLYNRHPDLRPPSLFGFVGAKWWDIVLIILFVALFVWEIKVLFTRADKRHRNEVGS